MLPENKRKYNGNIKRLMMTYTVTYIHTSTHRYTMWDIHTYAHTHIYKVGYMYIHTQIPMTSCVKK